MKQRARGPRESRAGAPGAPAAGPRAQTGRGAPAGPGSPPTAAERAPGRARQVPLRRQSAPSRGSAAPTSGTHHGDPAASAPACRVPSGESQVQEPARLTGEASASDHGCFPQCPRTESLQTPPPRRLPCRSPRHPSSSPPLLPRPSPRPAPRRRPQVTIHLRASDAGCSRAGKESFSCPFQQTPNKAPEVGVKRRGRSRR